MPSQLVITCSEIMKQLKLTIAFAESATAGRMASEFSLTENSGSILIGGLVCYDACIKQDILGIDPYFIEKFTPESAEVTREMATRLSNFIRSNIQVAVTGLTTPGGSENPDKPVGTIFLHILGDGISVAVRKVFEGDPQQIILQAIDLAAQTIQQQLESVYIRKV